MVLVFPRERNPQSNRHIRPRMVDLPRNLGGKIRHCRLNRFPASIVQAAPQGSTEVALEISARSQTHAVQNPLRAQGFYPWPTKLTDDPAKREHGERVPQEREALVFILFRLLFHDSCCHSEQGMSCSKSQQTLPFAHTGVAQFLFLVNQQVLTPVLIRREPVLITGPALNGWLLTPP